MRSIILSLAICVASSAVAAEYVSGNRLYEHCGKSGLDAGRDLCIGYVSAIADVMADGDSVDGYRACVPGAITAGQLQDLLFDHLDTYRLYRHHNASRVVARFLAETFPCE